MTVAVAFVSWRASATVLNTGRLDVSAHFSWRHPANHLRAIINGLLTVECLVRQ